MNNFKYINKINDYLNYISKVVKTIGYRFIITCQNSFRIFNSNYINNFLNYPDNIIVGHIDKEFSEEIFNKEFNINLSIGYGVYYNKITENIDIFYINEIKNLL